MKFLCHRLLHYYPGGGVRRVIQRSHYSRRKYDSINSIPMLWKGVLHIYDLIKYLLIRIQESRNFFISKSLNGGIERENDF